MSCEAKKKQHACTSSGLRDYYIQLFTDSRSNFLKCCTSATITAITQFITDLALFTKWNQEIKDRLNQRCHSEEPASPQALVLILWLDTLNLIMLVVRHLLTIIFTQRSTCIGRVKVEQVDIIISKNQALQV